MLEALNRKQVASHYGVSLPTVDAWVRKGCPFVTRGSKGVEWAFDLAAVQDWVARYWSRPMQVATPKGLQSFNTTEKAEVVRALGYVMRHCGAVVAEMAVKAGAPIKVAYVAEQMICIRLSGIAESYLEDRGVTGIDLIESFTSQETEPDWVAIAKSVGETFDEDACDRYEHELGLSSPAGTD